jgi:hypothetical protein
VCLQEFLEQVNIIPYPPPLHSFSWNQLTDFERKLAFGDLQDIARNDMLGTFVSQNGRSQEPRELRPWNLLDVWQRKSAFEILQVLLPLGLLYA